MAAPGAARHLPPRAAVLRALGFGATGAPGAAGGQDAVLATLAASETFRWLRRWALVAVVGLLTPITLITPFGNEMPAFHRLAVPFAVAVMLPAWVAELSGVRWPRLALIAATVLPNAWLTVFGHPGSILGQLQLASRTQAALYALRTGLAPLEEG